MRKLRLSLRELCAIIDALKKYDTSDKHFTVERIRKELIDKLEQFEFDTYVAVASDKSLGVLLSVANVENIK